MRAPRSALAVFVLLVSAAVAPAGGGQSSVHAGWPQLTDDPASGADLQPPIEGSSGKSGWFKHNPAVIADIGGRPGAEILSASLDGKVYAWHADGSRVGGWPRRVEGGGVGISPINGAPAVGDLDGNGSPEIVVGADSGHVFAFYADGRLVGGWPQFTGWNGDYPNNCATAACTGVWASPTLADLDKDGKAEVIVGSFSHKMFVWDGAGRVRPGWPRDVHDGIAATASVADVDGDGSPDIVVGSDLAFGCANCPPFGRREPGGLLHVFRADGTQLAGWPQSTDSFMWSSPAVTSIGSIVSGGGFFTRETETRGHHVYSWDGAGRLMWRHDTTGTVVGSVAAGDVNGDGIPEIAAGDTAGWLYLLRASDGKLLWKKGPEAGAYFGSPMLADVSGDGRADVVTVDANWRVRAWDFGGKQVFDAQTCYALWNSPAVGDVDGDGMAEIVAGSALGNGGSPVSSASRCVQHSSDPDLHRRAGQGMMWLFDTPGRGGEVWPQFGARRVGTWSGRAAAPGAATRSADGRAPRAGAAPSAAGTPAASTAEPGPAEAPSSESAPSPTGVAARADERPWRPWPVALALVVAAGAGAVWSSLSRRRQAGSMR